ncbi:hypothetical protein ACIBSV_46960 [Embleya sp. NPDC050154]|uniref:hypothetical protein n=1 Tax=Embleya sp. NPDC050154 TaxID=3363988 RepID=UPI0037A0E672
MSTEVVNGIASLVLTVMAGISIIRLFNRVERLERQAKETKRHVAVLAEIVSGHNVDVRQLQRERDGIGPE